MNFTTTDINNYRSAIRQNLELRNKLAQKINNGSLDNIPPGVLYILRVEEENQYNKEMETEALNNKSSICSPKLSHKLEGVVDFESLESTMGEQFTNYNAMRAVGCSVYSTFHGIPEASGNIAKLAHLKDSVRNLHKFGSESVNGYVLTGELDDASNMYVIKTPRTDDAEADLLHETFVGLFGTNKIRKELPNLALIYGGFKCSKAIINHETNEVESYCYSSPNQVPYVIYENITPSKSFDDVIRTCTVAEFHSLYLQVLFSTYIASELIGYTHYDAHTGNWLVRKVKVSGVSDGNKSKFCIPYTDPITKHVSYIVADSVATAIDFGMTSITYKGRNIGCSSIGLEEYGITSDPWPLHDAYKLLMFSALALIQSKTNERLVVELKKIFRFFNKTERLEDAVNLQRKSYYSLPKTNKTSDYGIIDLINHIK